ncbi:hypothetical protein EVAR_268_1 [Eumeta japonica]|uniref:Uncharacterized protein n=1 Tax=Eumeta variegata TaxID=151549 RepID=A0A4C1S9G3_EUMVA|nr:hypothetical protein EVAR_268_1 [Eumeta japonica]
MSVFSDRVQEQQIKKCSCSEDHTPRTSVLLGGFEFKGEGPAHANLFLLEQETRARRGSRWAAAPPIYGRPPARARAPPALNGKTLPHGRHCALLMCRTGRPAGRATLAYLIKDLEKGLRARPAPNARADLRHLSGPAVRGGHTLLLAFPPNNQTKVRRNRKVQESFRALSELVNAHYF